MISSKPATELPSTRVAGVPVHELDLEASLDLIDQFIADGTPHYNVAINAAKVVKFHHDATLRTAIEKAHLLTADGKPVVWASRLLGHPLPGRVNGTDLMEALLDRAASRGHSVYFFGAKQEIVETCVAKTRKLYPTLRIAGYRNGYFSQEDESAIVADIAASRPDILFLGFGTPRKEYFMNTHYRALQVPFVMGVGGTFDVLAGLTKRAPRWMQNSGLEWFFRFTQEPRRMWKRYLIGNSQFIALVAKEYILRGRRRP